ncbi:MAG: Maf family nucleotide pyrophosphatase [Culturomica sp.]|jgi:septum formation protein|nr:Maf family nucleotide pyrophosphatase [Culturomica sp.]
MECKLILASASPRRQQLLRDAGFEFEVRTKEVEEVYPPELPVEQVPEYLARLKAEAFRSELRAGEWLITADTVVCLEGVLLGKPADRADAIRMLEALSGRKHTVISGVCLTAVDRQTAWSVATGVYFTELSAEEIARYVDVYKPFDKAGAYGIQEWIGYIGIERIEGSFYNVMGLPVQTLYRELKKLKENH